MLYFIYDFFYPAYKAGGPIQSLVNLANEIGEIQDVSVICSNKDLDGSVLPVNTGEPVSYKHATVYYSSKGFNHYSRIVKKHSENTFYINGIFSLQYNLFPLLFLKGRRIVSVRGMLHPEALAQKSFKKKVYLQLLKLLRIGITCEFHATSTLEKGFIQNVFGDHAKVWVIPNLPGKIAYQPPPSKKEGTLILCTIALISPMKNHLLVLHALQKCKSIVLYYIYGPIKDQAYWQECLRVIDQMPHNVRVIYMKDIKSDRIEEALSKVHVYIQPSKSENFGHSLFEALAVGRPVITSMNTPWNELKANNAGANVNSNNIGDLTEQIDFFGEMGTELFINYCRSARSYSEKFVDVIDIKRKYLEMFNDHSDKRLEFNYKLN